MIAAVPAFLAASALWLDVPFVKQEKNGCGSAALAMVIGYWQRRAPALHAEAGDPARIQQALYSAEARGIYASAMERYLEEHGFRAFAFRGEWEDLERNLAKGRPLIVCLGDGKSRHYVVVAGLEDGAVEVNDPADRKLRKLDRAGFEKRWRAASCWTLLAVPRASP